IVVADRIGAPTSASAAPALAAGLIAPQIVESGRGPQRTIYAATPAGHEAAAAWLDTPVEHVRDVRSHLLIKLAAPCPRGHRRRRSAPAAEGDPAADRLGNRP